MHRWTSTEKSCLILTVVNRIQTNLAIHFILHYMVPKNCCFLNLFLNPKKSKFTEACFNFESPKITISSMNPPIRIAEFCL